MPDFPPKILLKEHSVDSVSPTGNTVEVLVEITDRLMELSGWIDLSEMEPLDDVFIRVYGRVEPGGSWILNATEEYINAQARPLIYILAKKVHYGVRVTLQQIGGTYDNTYRYNFFKEELA